MAHVATKQPKPTEEASDEGSIPSLFSFAGGVIQLFTLVILAGLFLVTSIPHMSGFGEMDPADPLPPEVGAYRFVFNVFCYISMSTALIGIIKSKGERLKVACVGFLAGLVCVGFNIVVPYLL